MRLPQDWGREVSAEVSDEVSEISEKGLYLTLILIRSRNTVRSRTFNINLEDVPRES